ncbi:MAG: lysophospholipase [Anaerolineales bacterium]|nr:lysophospholipase [Anaerolineales bacterium]
MNRIEGTFPGVRGIEIYHQAWLPEGEAKAALLIVHGLGEHGGRYGNVVNRFVPLGFAAYALDHIGHGKSGGRREYVERFDDYTDTLAIYHRIVQARQPGLPVFLLGHSMGGLIAVYYLLEHQEYFRGAVIFAPAIRVPGRVSPAVIAAGKVLAVLAPTAEILPLDPRAVSRDPHVVEAYIRDPLVHHRKTSARLAAEILKTILAIENKLGKISLPLIALQGTADKLAHPDSARMLYDRAGSADKTLKLYEGLYHETHNEPEREKVLDDVQAWLAARL